jgi:hypothetical protein
VAASDLSSGAVVERGDVIATSLQAAIAQEFGSYYHVDELPVVTSDSFVSDELPKRATASARRLEHVVGDDARSELAELLRTASDDPSHPLVHSIARETLIDWHDEEGTWKVLQLLLRQIADTLSGSRANR